MPHLKKRRTRHAPPPPRLPRHPDGLAELEASQSHYATLYDYAPFGYVVLDSSGMIRSANLTAASMLGRQRHDVIGRPFLIMVAPPDRRRYLAHLSRLRRGQGHSTTEVALHNPAGQLVWVQVVSAVRATSRPHLVEFHTALVDISERRHAEVQTSVLARLGLLLSAASDPAGAARAITDAAQELCGWDACFLLLRDPQTNAITHLLNMDTIGGQRVPVEPKVLGPELSPLLKQVLRDGGQLILRKSADDPGVPTLPFGDTSRRSLSLMFVPIWQENDSMGVLSIQSYKRDAYTPRDLATLQVLADHVTGALARLQAVAELRQAKEELEQRVAERTAELQRYRDHLEVLVAQRTRELEAANARLREEIQTRQDAQTALMRAAAELRRSNEELEQFAYVASHDLQEPLRAVDGYVRLLEHRFPDKLDAKMHEYIQGAAEGATRMEQQLTDLLALSRVGSLGLKLQMTDLSKPLQAALRNLQFSIRSSEARITCDKLPTLPVDGMQIGQVFQNLIGNAIKFRGESPLEIHIGARQDNGEWVIWVKDNGIGIGHEYFSRIFQVFQRLHTRKKHAGTGIGLAICKKIVERHGGRIWVESEPGKGATFYFALPVKAQGGA